MYGQYGPYNPYAGATQQMQQRLNYLQQQQQMYQPAYQQSMQQAPVQLKGRIVTSIDEAKAAQVDLDGSSTYFPAPAEGKVYEKLIGMDGLPVFRVYTLQEGGAQKQPVYADNNVVIALQRRIEKLEEQIGGMTNDEHISDDADGAAGRKSNGTNAAVRRTKSANE
jgi:hypothetical protein|nr:MAG TPA: hypothetical protein [Caudoviricetes sp.]DAX29420.1 MAG TPA: hypothetical protein [Caudoviricetes sp.]DAY48020.1 MAG TPA: hypothetical protein [Caudoviricetes sp.]